MSQDLTKFPTMNPTFTVKQQTKNSDTSKVIIEPLEAGYGHTLGNALRRVMLSSLPGHAITQVRIDGVDHQYSSLEGLSEDVVELILNLKQIRLKSESNDPGTLTIKVKGAAEVTGADIECSAGYEVINTDAHIATIAKGKSLNVEMVAEPGMGYVMAEEKKAQAIGDIMVDALFAPVVKASYTVESTRVGRRTDYDKLIIDIMTDGTIAPVDAVKQAATILRTQFNQVIDPVVQEVEEEEDELSPQEAEVLRLTVEELDLPTRIANALRKGGFKTVGSLNGASKDVVAKVKNLGEKSVDVINEALEKKGVSLGD